MEKLKFIPFPKLKTERLFFRQLKDSDIKELFSLRSNDSVNQYLKRPKQKRIHEAKEFISSIKNDINQNKCFYWAITLKSERFLIGTICFFNFSKANKCAEIGYELLPEYQGLGLMNEALKCIIEFGFKEIGLNSIDAFTHKDNVNSLRLLMKNNFFLNDKRENPKNIDFPIYTLNRDY